MTRDELFELVKTVSTRPTMYGVQERYDCFVAFLFGIDAAEGWSFLEGFSQWVGRKYYGEPTSVGWEGLIRDKISPGSRMSQLSRQDDEAARALLISLLEEFMVSGKSDGVVAVEDPRSSR